MSTWVEWVEPFGPNSEPVYCRVTKETAVATQKHSANDAKPGFIYESDERALEDFMTVQWANFVEI
jgi:hypothetical protein